MLLCFSLLVMRRLVPLAIGFSLGTPCFNHHHNFLLSHWVATSAATRLRDSSLNHHHIFLLLHRTALVAQGLVRPRGLNHHHNFQADVLADYRPRLNHHHNFRRDHARDRPSLALPQSPPQLLTVSPCPAG